MRGRTFLFAPASDLKKAEKALASAADIVVLDLEDAVALSEKEQARANIESLLKAGNAKPVLVRINAVTSPWALKDLLAVLPLNPDGIMLPKAEIATDAKKVCWIITQVMGTDSEIGIYPLIETAAGVEQALAIAQASRRVRRLVFGALDYSLDLGLNYTGDSSTLAYARARLVGASAAARLEGPVDTVYPALKDEEGLRKDTLAAQLVGFKGKLVIHPAQIEVVNEMFTPPAEEIEDARQIVSVYRQAQAEGKGAVQWKGKMLDEPVLKRAEQVLAQYGQS